MKGEFRFTDFYGRRVKRIFPALILVLGATFAFGWFALFPNEYKLLAKHMLGGAGFISNLLLWFEVSYFDTAAETKPLLHLWTLGIEEQFYIFWPIMLVLAYRFRTNVLRLAVVLLFMSFLVDVCGIHRFPTATFYSIGSRAWELLAGAFLAYLSLRKVRVHIGGVRGGIGQDPAASRPLFDTTSLETRSLMSFIGLALLSAGVGFTVADKSFPGWWALLPVGGAALLIAAGPHAWVNRVMLSSRVMVWIGLISYPLYLWHWPLLSFARTVESGVPSLKIRVIAVAAAVVLITLTYWLLEKPLRRKAHRRTTVAGLCAAMLLLAAASGWVYHQDGLPLRASIVQNANLQKELVLVEDRDNAAACKKRYGFETLWEYCLIGQLDKPPTVALIGDSDAYHVVAGLMKYYTERGENLVYWGNRRQFFGIVPEFNDKFQEATPEMLELALHTESVKTVIISNIVKMDDTTAAGKLLIAQFRDTLQKYVDAGKHVINISDVPGLPFDPRACIRRAAIPSTATNRDCTMSTAEFEKSVAKHNSITNAILKQFPMVTTFSTSKYLCDPKRCHGMIDKKLMYRDTHHLTYDGDLYIGTKFAAEQDARFAPK